MAENWERAHELIRSAVFEVYEPAMRRYFADRFEEAYGRDWFDHATRGRLDKSGKLHYPRSAYKKHVELVRAKERDPRDVFEAGDFSDLVTRKKGDSFVFPPDFRKLSAEMDIIRDYRNQVSHAAEGRDLQLEDVARALSNCKVLLKAIEDDGAVNTIGELQNQLNDLASGDATNLTEQDGGPPTRRIGGGVRLTWEWVWKGVAGVVFIAIIAVLAGLCAASSGNGPPVCSEIDDVVLTGPGDPNGTVALGGYCTDADDDELTFSAASSDNDIVSAAVEGDLLTLTAGDGSGGTATITVTATDPDGRSAPASFGVTVNPPQSSTPNRRPDCDDVEDVTIVGGDAQEIPVSCSDLDGDTITLRVSAGSQTDHHSVSPGTASIDGSGTQSFTIAGRRSSAGASYVEIEADDGKGGTDLVRFSVVVDAAVVDAGEDEPTELDEPEPPPVVPPEIEGGIRCAPSPVAVNASVNCTVSLSHGTPPFRYEWSGGSSSNTTSSSYSASFGSEGSQSVSLTVNNAAGSDDASTTVEVMEVPTINNLGCPSSATENQAVNCSPSVSGTEPLTYRWSGGGSGGSSSTYSPSWSSAGRKTVYLTVTNAVGSDDGSTSVVVDEDVRRPEIDSIICESPVATNASTNCRVNLSGGAPDSYSWSDSDGGSGSSASYRASFSSPGSKTVSLTVRNRADSDNDSTALQVMAPPSINSVSCSPSETGTGNSVNCSASVSGTGPLTYTWGGGDWGGSSSSYSPSWSTAGTKTVRLSVKNDVGDDSSSTTVIVVAAPVINSISCASSPVATNTSVNCTVSLSDGTPPFTYEWRGGSSSNTTGGSYSTSFGSEGSQTVSLTVSNGGGDNYASTTVRVMAPPTINSLGCPSSATVNQAVTCSPNISGTGPLTYSWSGGDSPSSGSNARHSPSWNTAGTKTVRLSVTNAVGDDSKSISVDVDDIDDVDGVNRAPKCRDSSTSVFMETGRSTILNLRSLCDDPDGDSLSYIVAPHDDSVAIGSERNGLLTINAANSRGGDTRIEITVEDGRGGFTIVNAFVHVEGGVVFSPPQPPVRCEIDDLDLVEGDYERLDLDAYCDYYHWGMNRLTVLTLTAESDNSSIVSLDGPFGWGVRGVLHVNAVGVGTATITIRATLMTDSDEQTDVVARFTVRVTGDVTCSLDPDDDEILTSLTHDPATYTYALRCEDLTGAQLAYTLPSDDSDVADASYDGETLTISIRGRGTTTINFTATAPGGQSWKEDFVVWVIP